MAIYFDTFLYKQPETDLSPYNFLEPSQYFSKALDLVLRSLKRVLFCMKMVVSIEMSTLMSERQLCADRRHSCHDKPLAVDTTI